MANKQKKKRIKKYKGKYVTANRLDMSKGGRVQANIGGPFSQAPMRGKRPTRMSIQREDEETKTVAQPPVPPIPTTPPVPPSKPTLPPRGSVQPPRRAPVQPMPCRS